MSADTPYYGTCVECLQVKRVKKDLTLFDHNCDVIASETVKVLVACRGSGSTPAEARNLSWNDKVDPPRWVEYDYSVMYPQAGRVVPPS